MDLRFTVSALIAKPVSAVFEAVVDPGQLSSYFTTGGAVGRLEAGNSVSWDFHDFPGATPVEVVEVVQDQKIELRWDANDSTACQGNESGNIASGYKTTVVMLFEATGDARTLVTITEFGWRETETGLKASYGNCMGWSHMLCALKVWMEHGINLREGVSSHQSIDQFPPHG